MDLKGNCTVLKKQENENSNYLSHTKGVTLNGNVFTISTSKDSILQFNLESKELSVLSTEFKVGGDNLFSDGKTLYSIGWDLCEFDPKNGKKTIVRSGAVATCGVVAGSKMYWRRENEIYEYDMGEKDVEKYKFKNGNDGCNGEIMSCYYQFEIKGKNYYVGNGTHVLEYDVKTEKIEPASKEKVPFSLRHAVKLGNRLVFLQTNTNSSTNVVSIFDPETRDVKEIPLKDEDQKKFFGGTMNAFSTF